jgi:hypothetical protein
MTREEIKQVLDLHAEWLGNYNKGKRADLSGADLYAADLSGADLSGADLSVANLYGANLYGANLYVANLSGADLYGANLPRANLYGANLSRANLSGANLSGANLYGANLYGANLYGANLSGANLSGANLSGANLSGANLPGADLSGAKLDKGTRLSTGETWEEYRRDVVGALLANSVAIEEIVAKSWQVHDWTGCPMAARFHTDKIGGVPALLRPRAEQFIQFFDARLLDDLPEEMGWLPKKEAQS